MKVIECPEYPNLKIKILEMPRKTPQRIKVLVDVVFAENGKKKTSRKLAVTSTMNGRREAREEIMMLLPLFDDKLSTRGKKRVVSSAVNNTINAAYALCDE